MERVYCTATIELKDFNNSESVVKYFKDVGVAASYESDVIFIGDTFESENVQELLINTFKEIIPCIKDSHEILSVNCNGDSDLDSFEIIIDGKKLYLKSAQLIEY